MMKNKARKRLGRHGGFDLGMNALILVFCVLQIFPLYWLLTGAVKYSADIMKIPPDWFPARVTLQNFSNIFGTNPAARWMFNSLLVSVTATAGIILVSSAAGYALSKLRFVGKKALLAFIIAGLILPKEVYLLPLYQQMVSYNWVGSYSALILPELAMPFGVYLLMQFYDTIPGEIAEAARIDGCGEGRFFFAFGLPLTKPGIGALGILAFIRVWNSYLWQFVVARDKAMYTLPVGVAQLFDDPFNVDFGLKFAGATITALPLLLIFIFFQRYFTSGITTGAVKG